jgi:hypothetical protein
VLDQLAELRRVAAQCGAEQADGDAGRRDREHLAVVRHVQGERVQSRKPIR